MAKLGVVLLNLGAPATLNDIQPFLRALFSDRDLFPWFSGLFWPSDREGACNTRQAPV